MKKMFEDTKIGAVLSGTIDVLWAGLLWLFCSLPVVTVGPASAALYYTMVKAIRRERGSVGKTFFSAFAANFRVSFLIWLVYLIVIGPLLFLPQLVLLYVVPLGMTLPWVFAYVSRFECSVADAARSVLALCIRNLVSSLELAVILAVALVVGYLVPGLIPLLPGIFCLMMSFIIEPVFKSISMEKEGDTNEDQWYNE